VHPSLRSGGNLFSATLLNDRWLLDPSPRRSRAFSSSCRLVIVTDPLPSPLRQQLELPKKEINKSRKAIQINRETPSSRLHSNSEGNEPIETTEASQ